LPSSVKGNDTTGIVWAAAAADRTAIVSIYAPCLVAVTNHALERLTTTYNIA
jgi:hypothetical protein